MPFTPKEALQFVECTTPVIAKLEARLAGMRAARDIAAKIVAYEYTAKSLARMVIVEPPGLDSLSLFIDFYGDAYVQLKDSGEVLFQNFLGDSVALAGLTADAIAQKVNDELKSSGVARARIIRLQHGFGD
jgi:hypothetical protein